MSQEQAEAFLKAVQENEELTKEFENCFAINSEGTEKLPQEQEEAVIADVVALAKARGFDFDAQDALALHHKMQAQAEAELSDEELEAVAGGKSSDDKQMAGTSWATAGTACLAASGILKIHVKRCMDPMWGG